MVKIQGEFFFVLVIISAKIMLDKIMLKDIKLPLNISLMEAFTLISFFVIGHLFIYRFCYYNTLGIPWYITSISPAQVIISSGKVLFNLFVAGMIGFFIIYITKNFKEYKKRILLFFIILFQALWLMLMFFEEGFHKEWVNSFFEATELSLPNILNFSLSILLIYFVIVGSSEALKNNVLIIENLIVPNKVLTPIENIKNIRKNKFIYNIFAIILISITTPLNVGNKDALHLMENREDILNRVVLKVENKKWYLVDFSGDKMLLIGEHINGAEKNEYKLIEYKEVKYIISPRNEDMDTKILNYAKKNW